MRFRPRFSLRTLLVLVALAAIPAAWAGYQLNWIRQRHEFLRTKIRGEHWVSFAREFEDAPWSLRLFGEWSAFGPVYLIAESDLPRGHDLFPEATFTLIEWQNPQNKSNPAP